jgi:hypothetical protein
MVAHRPEVAGRAGGADTGKLWRDEAAKTGGKEEDNHLQKTFVQIWEQRRFGPFKI